MKQLSIAVLLLLLTPVAAEAQSRCRSDQHPTQHIDNRIVTGSRSVLPTLQVGYETAEPRTFGIKGIVCDADLAPLAGVRIELVRVERDAGGGPLSVDAFVDGSVTRRESFEVVSLENGKFVATGLPPGHYALQSDWDSISDSRRVLFDVRVVPGPSRQSPIAQAGLLQPH